MFINGIPLFTSIDKTLRYRALVPLENRYSDELFRALDTVLRHYNSAGYQAKTIYCDREFKKIMDEIKDELDVDMNYTGMDEHVPEAEWNNRTISKWIRVAYHYYHLKLCPA